jgi:hypothetical protein
MPERLPPAHISRFVRVWCDHHPDTPLHSANRTVNIDIVEDPWKLDRTMTDQLIARLIEARQEAWPAFVDERFPGLHPDIHGVVRIGSIQNLLTKEWFELPETAGVHIDDLGTFFDEHQARFVAEWNAAHPDDLCCEDSQHFAYDAERGET